DRGRHRAYADGKELELTPTEFRLLESLVRQPGRAFTRHQLMDAAIGEGAIVLERTIDVHVKTLRRKLGAADLIETVRGVGYRFRESRGGDEEEDKPRNTRKTRKEEQRRELEGTGQHFLLLSSSFRVFRVFRGSLFSLPRQDRVEGAGRHRGMDLREARCRKQFHILAVRPLLPFGTYQ